jgi:prolyl-tRNA editing enzyme YbaK/EbsC (Cys-tRNA(Pro) deacylase)
MSAVTEHLQQRGSAFELLPHRQAYTSTDEARALGIDAGEVLKTLAVRTGPSYMLAVIPASRRLDLHLVREALGDHQARLASEEEPGRDFPGYQLGALPPLGALLGSQVYVDPEVLEHDLVVFAALAREHDALLYLDDAHGFGVIGQRSRDEPSPYGRRGNGVVRHLGESYDHVILTGGFSKAYSSLLAFIAGPSALKRLLKVAAPPYLYSGPSPTASLASALVGLQINDTRGDELRAVLHARTQRVLDHLDKLGAATLNTSGFPIIEVPLAGPQDLPRAGRFLLDHGIYATLAFYPGVPRQEVGFRLQLTAATTDQQVTELLAVLDRLADTIPLRPRHP